MNTQPVPKKVPFELSHLVCICEPEQQKSAHHPTNNNAFGCSNCGKYFRYVMRTCNNCKEPFVQTFQHPLRCITDPLCWTCLEGMLDLPVCEHVSCNKVHDYQPPPPIDLTKRKVRPLTLDFNFGDDL